ncbi:glycoside hydrolase family 30 protein [Chryseobacterium sp.]|uniref:glycoside hydrolase family 30 protein n=1 Tax=Chryseobacterium sp. TaxID=1871047 RepID=UPI0038901794
MKTNTFSFPLLIAILISCTTTDLEVKQIENPPKEDNSTLNKVASEQYGVWTTSQTQNKYLAKTSGELSFTNSVSDANPILEVDSRGNNRGQYIDGFGYTLTGGSAELLSKMSQSNRTSLLNEIYNNATASQNKNDVIRVSIGGEDLSRTAYTLNDLPSGQTDLSQSKLSLSKDNQKIAILKEIIAINPNIKIFATPWSAPAWMKTNGNLSGGSLRNDQDTNNNQIYFSSYADYFVKYIQQMKNQGITIYAITPQNEPLNGNNNPSMIMYDYEQANFIRYHLGPKLKAAGLATKIIAYDHNADNNGVNYVKTLFADAVTKSYIHGTAWHLYDNSDINNLTAIRDQDASKGIYFTEQWLEDKNWDDGSLLWHVNKITIGSLNNWSKTVMEWNLASDPGTTINTPGGCFNCLGALTINGNSVQKNISYYSLAHASRFLGENAQRLFPRAHNAGADINYAALVNDQSPYARIMIITNGNSATKNMNLKYITYDGVVKYAKISVPGNSVQTYVWRQ